MKWHELDTGRIISGVTADGSSLLKAFLIDYKREFHVDTVNPSCGKCIKSYHSEFVKKYSNMDNTSNYTLHRKREGLRLKFGSPIFVNNKNLTDEYAEILIKRFQEVNKDFDISYLFAKYPKETTEVKEVTPKKKRSRSKKS